MELFLLLKNEAEIISANGAVLRPDRVAMKDNSVVIIDYKTGLMSNSHAKQITQYGDALNEIGFDLVTKLIREKLKSSANISVLFLKCQ